MSRLKVVLITFLLLFSISLLVISIRSGASSNLRIDFLDVGQGDAVLITSPSGSQMLIDAGRDTAVLRSLGKVLPFTDRKIEVILATHPDADHIGGFPRFLDRFEVDHIIGVNSFNESGLFESFIEKSYQEKAELLEARRGMVIDLGSGVLVQVLFPYKDTTITGNDASVVVKVIYGETEVLLTGDVGVSTENHLIEIENDFLESDILKLGHHGSKTSSGKEFLEKVDPQVAVISAGKDNSYGHPHQVVIENLGSIPFFETSEEGNITFFSDGGRFWRK